MPHNKQHIALKNKAKKGLLFFALLLGIFTFSGVVTIAQRGNLLTQSELVLKAAHTAKSAIRYKSAAQIFYKSAGSFCIVKCDLAAATVVFDRLIKTKGLYLSRLAIPKRQVFFPYYTNIPHAAGPEQPAYGA